MQIPFSKTRQKIDEMGEAEFYQFLEEYQDALGLLPEADLQQIEKLLANYNMLALVEGARTNFLDFVTLVRPNLIFSSYGQHHEIARTFEQLVDGDLKRCVLSLAPRFGKSEFGSICLPAWAVGKHPDWKIIQASAGDTLATDFGRQVKEIIDLSIYDKIFPGVKLSKDSKAAGKFATNRGGQYYAVGVNTNLAGRGADLFIADDPTTEQEMKTGDASVFERIWTWYQSGPIQRLQPSGRMVIIQTRWSKADLVGRVLQHAKDNPDVARWKELRFPALDAHEESTFPELWSTAELKEKRASMLPAFWNAQYMQRPSTASTQIVPRSMWRKWDDYRKIEGNTTEVEFVPPDCHITIMVFDTAYTVNKKSNPTACTIWGCFTHYDDETGEGVPCVILLHSLKKKMEFEELKTKAREWINEWSPDVVLIEEKSSGPMLRSELSRAGILTEGCVPRPKEDKMSRLVSVTPVFASNRVFYVPTMANEACVEEVADFGSGGEDDFTDCTAYAIRYFRTLGYVGAADDVKDDSDSTIRRGSKY